jgi:hypothetical protein
MQNLLNFKRKRGEVNVLTMVLFILLSILAVSLLYLAILTLTPSLSPTNSCADLSRISPISIEKACYNQNSGDFEIIVNRYGNVDFKSIEFMIKGSSESLWKCGDDCNSCKVLENGVSKIYYLNMLNLNFNDDSKYKLFFSAENCQLIERDLVLC